MSAPELPGSLRTNPRLATWLRFAREGHVELAPGKVEIGQGILTALTQIAADELDLDPGRVRLAQTTTGRSPNEGVTSSSLSVQDGGIAVRYACAEARAIYLAAAADRLGVPAESLSVNDGTIVGPGNARTSYWELADDALLARDATATVPPKASASRRLAGRSAQRLDIPDKVFGKPRFMHDLRLPGLLHARMLRPRERGASLASLDESAARAIAGVVVIARDGNHLGLVAESEEAAEAGLRALVKGARWQAGWTLPPVDDLRTWLKAQKVETRVIDARGAGGEAPAGVHRTLRRQYSKPYIAHASLAPSCAIACWHDGGVEIWSHTQGVYNLRAELSIILGLPVEKIVVRHVEGAGCYGHNGADDVALDAVLLARAVEGRPLRLQWSREDELAWSPFGPAMAVDLEADLDENGNILAWRHDLWSNGHVGRPGRSQLPTLLAASEIARPFDRFIAGDPPQVTGGGSDRNSVPYYDFGNWRIRAHRLLTMPLRTSAMRTLGGFANIFAIESFLDELAHETGQDPLAFRCVTSPIHGRGRCWKRRRGVPAGVRGERAADAVSESVSDATRILAPFVPASPRSIAAVSCGSSISGSRSMSARWSILMASPIRSKAARSRRPAGR